MFTENLTQIKGLTMIEAMTQVYEKREGLFKDQQQLESLNEVLEKITAFLGIEPKVAALLSVIVCDQILSDKTPIRKLMKYMGLSPSEVFQLNEAIKSMKRKGWLELRERSLDRASSRFESVEITKMLLDALYYNDSSKLQRKEPKELGDALMMANRFIVQSIGDYEIDEFSSVVCHFVSGYKQFKLLRTLIENSVLTDLEKTMLLWVLIEYYQGKDIHDFNHVLELFLMDPVYCSSYKKSIVHGCSNLFLEGYLNFHKNQLTDLSEVTLSEEWKDALETETNRLILTKQRFTKCLLIEPSDIDEQHLYFNQGAQIRIDNLQALLCDSNYRKILERFEKNNMKPSLSILIYGKPGTGKTEFVKQVAKRYNRAILQVDIASIKDMWVGESEKNLKRVFFEYAQALKKFPTAPILLFNEADALLGLRTKVNDSASQMLNAMQNILLQELEDFKGILVATTNLTQNMDAAFDRRILYKQLFDLPDQETRERILKSHFPDIDDDTLEQLASKYNLSGGQISNIKKKYLANAILFEESGNIENDLLMYVEEEIGFRQNVKSIIGFVNSLK